MVPRFSQLLCPYYVVDFFAFSTRYVVKIDVGVSGASERNNQQCRKCMSSTHRVKPVSAMRSRPFFFCGISWDATNRISKTCTINAQHGYTRGYNQRQTRTGERLSRMITNRLLSLFLSLPVPINASSSTWYVCYRCLSLSHSEDSSSRSGSAPPAQIQQTTVRAGLII